MAKMIDTYSSEMEYGRSFYGRHNGTPRQSGFIFFYHWINLSFGPYIEIRHRNQLDLNKLRFTASVW